MSLADRLRPAPRALATAPALGRSSTGWRDSARRDPAGAGRLRPPAEIARSIATAIGRYRRLIGAACVALAVMIGLGMLTSHPASGTAVVTAAHDVPAGAILTAADLRSVVLAPTTVPAGAITEVSAAVGHTTSGELRAGEPLTDVRLSDGPLAAPAQGMVASAVRLADAQAAGLLRAGEHVDVLAASASVSTSVSTASQPEVAPSAAAVVAADVIVVAVTPPPAVGPAAVADPAFEGALVVLATTPDQARVLAQAQVSDRLSAVVVR